MDRDGDIALDDLARMKNCMFGPDVAHCGEHGVYLDADWDVDLRDFSSFQRCFSGADVPADVVCGD